MPAVPKPTKRPPKAKGHIKPRSTKRAAQERLYAKLRAEYLKNNPECMGNFEGCTFVANEVHHKYSGSKRNMYLLEVDTWMAICRCCHNQIHNNPKKAKELGLLL